MSDSNLFLSRGLLGGEHELLEWMWASPSQERCATPLITTAPKAPQAVTCTDCVELDRFPPLHSHPCGVSSLWVPTGTVIRLPVPRGSLQPVSQPCLPLVLAHLGSLQCCCSVRMVASVQCDSLPVSSTLAHSIIGTSHLPHRACYTYSKHLEQM